MKVESVVRQIIPATIAIGLSACGGSSGGGSDATLANNDDYRIAGGILNTFSGKSGVLENDSGTGLTAQLLDSPANADTFSFNGDGSFEYQSDSQTVLSDQFTYSVTGSDGLVSSATVSLTVYPKPVAMADIYSVEPGQTLVIDANGGVLANDVYSTGTLAAELQSTPSDAEDFNLQSDGSFTYVASINASGSDSFNYTLDDGLQQSSPATVTISIDNGVLSGSNDNFTVVSGAALDLSGAQGILKNDSGTTGATVSVQKLPDNAIDFNLGSDGRLVYRTVTQSETSDTFSYLLTRDQQTLGPFRVTLTISQPSASQETPDAFDQCLEYATGQTVSGVLQASGVANASYELLSDPKLGTLTAFDPASGQFSYQRNSNARGADTFSYRIRNASNQSVGDATFELIETPYRVMPVGDSITSGVEFFDSSISKDTPDSEFRVGYRKFFKDSLTSLGYSIDLVGSRSDGQNVSGFSDVQHNGHPGQGLSFVRDNMAEWLARDPADIFLIHIGTNGTPGNMARTRAMVDNIDNWEASQNNPATIMMAKLITRIDNNAGENAIAAYNSLLDDFISARKEEGDRMFEVDQFSAFGSGGELSPDGLHPTLSGYQIMSNTWRDRLIATGVLRKCN